MIRAVALVDLDDTLFQTLRKRPAEVAEADLTPLAYAVDGAPLGFATPVQNTFLRWLSETTRLIPVTARSLEALRRVRIPFTAAICAHGGVLLDERGEPDRSWAEEIASAAATHRPQLEALAADLSAEAGAIGTDMRVRILCEAGTPLYVLAKHPAADEAALGAVADAVTPRVPADWTVHRNGNNLALLPPFLCKSHAVRRLLPQLRAQHPGTPVIGVGDSLSDAPFLALCDFAMTPRGSQLAQSFLP